MTFDREYDANDLVALLREHDGLTTVELAEMMDAPYETTRSRCSRLEKEGRIQRMIYGKAQTEEFVWFLTSSRGVWSAYTSVNAVKPCFRATRQGHPSYGV